jgi:hypothetical protein
MAEGVRKISIDFATEAVVRRRRAGSQRSSTVSSLGAAFRRRMAPLAPTPGVNSVAGAPVDSGFA